MHEIQQMSSKSNLKCGLNSRPLNWAHLTNVFVKYVNNKLEMFLKLGYRLHKCDVHSMFFLQFVVKSLAQISKMKSRAFVMEAIFLGLKLLTKSL